MFEHIIDFLEIQAFRQDPRGPAADGLQKRVDLGRAWRRSHRCCCWMNRWRACNVVEKQDMCRFILDVNDEFGTTIVLIEHDMGVVMDISDRVVVLDYGKKIGDGSPDEVRNNEDADQCLSGHIALRVCSKPFQRVRMTTNSDIRSRRPPRHMLAAWARRGQQRAWPFVAMPFRSSRKAASAASPILAAHKCGLRRPPCTHCLCGATYSMKRL